LFCSQIQVHGRFHIFYVQKAAAHFDLYQINPVKVSKRDGLNYVFNGQHTIEIIALVSGSRDTPVWCMVYDDLEYAHEADIFANQMKYTKPLSPYEIFMANIEAGSDKHLMIQALVESYDLQITASGQPGGICAVATLETIHDKYGYHILDRTLRLIIGTWEGTPMSFSANMLNGVARLINVYHDELRDDTFKDRLSKVSAKEISRTAKERRAGSLGYAESILLIYNKKCHNPLRLEKLYSVNKKKSQQESPTEQAPVSAFDSMPEGQISVFSEDMQQPFSQY